MAYTIDTSKEIWHVTFSGTMTNRDLQKAIAEAKELEGKSSPVPNRIIDLRPVTGIDVGFSEINAIASTRREHPLPNRIKSAIITNGPVQYGIARMFQTLLEHPNIEVHVFSDEQEALEWIVK